MIKEIIKMKLYYLLNFAVTNDLRYFFTEI